MFGPVKLLTCCPSELFSAPKYNGGESKVPQKTSFFECSIKKKRKEKRSLTHKHGLTLKRRANRTRSLLILDWV